MGPLSTSLIAAGVGVLVAIIARISINRLSTRLGRKVVVREKSGKEKYFEFEPGVSSNEMREAIRKELNLEHYVKVGLDSYLQSIGKANARAGKWVDFIADIGSEKIAVEVKSNLTRFNSEMFHKYMSEEPNISRLVLFIPQSVTSAIRSESLPFEEQGKLRVVVLDTSQDAESQFRQIADVFSAAKTTP